MKRPVTAMIKGSLVLGCLVLLSGCVGMPTEGPVVESAASADLEEAPGFSFDPRPPQPDQSPAEIVSGFLEAMQATPIRTSVARTFLASQAQETWAPESRIITYAEREAPVGQTNISLQLTDTHIYDERGAWQRAEEDVQLSFELTHESGEWRISRVPDALIVPETWFDDWYERVSLYFFDPTTQILVPEPVFAPKGDQFASALVRGLLTSPGGEQADVARTSFPPGLAPGLSVPISSTGIAEVSLSGDPAVIDDDTAQRMLAQLVWTLRQEPRVRAIQLTVGDQAFGGPDGTTQVDLDVGEAFDPTGSEASQALYGLQDGRLVRGTLDSLAQTAGPFGQADLGLRSVGVNLTGTRAAGVTGDGTALLVAPVDKTDGRATEVLSGATDLLAPAWDFQDRTWLVDRTPQGARLLVITNRRAREVEVPGLTGRDVTRLLVSRDGSRLVAVVRGRASDRVVAARVRHDARGRILGATRGRTLPGDIDGTGRIRDVAWRSTTTVFVLSNITDALSQVRTIPVDGAPGDILTEASSRPQGKARSLVSSPVPGSQVLAMSRRTVTDLITPERALPELPPERVLPDLPAGLTYLTYVG